ncbi:MAG: hypothetical protein WBP61_08030 [Nocardioides sp.]
MTSPSTLTSVPRSQLALRAVVLLGPLVALLATGPAGQWPPWWLVVLVGGLSTAAALAPDSPAGVGAGLVVLGWWALSLSAELPAWVLLAAVALVLAHLAALVASYGPRTMPVDASTALLWARRGAWVLLTVPGAWLVSRLVQGEPEPWGIWVMAVAAACAATVAATAALGARAES